MKGELVVAHVEHLLDEGCPQYLLGGEPLTPLLHADLPSANEVMPDCGER